MRWRIEMLPPDKFPPGHHVSVYGRSPVGYLAFVLTITDSAWLVLLLL
jgi:hypothetical protein